jgi:hypothetical protein
MLVQVRPLRGPGGEYGAHGVVDIEQDASRVYDFMRQVRLVLHLALFPGTSCPGWKSLVAIPTAAGRVPTFPMAPATFVLQIEEQPKWNAGVKLSQVVGKVNQTTTHVKQVGVCRQ